MEQVIPMIFPLIFVNNLVLSLIKYLAGEAATKVWLRVMLGFLSLAGVIATAAIFGTPIDFNSVSDIALTVLETALTALGAHFSYVAIKYA